MSKILFGQAAFGTFQQPSTGSDYNASNHSDGLVAEAGNYSSYAQSLMTTPQAVTHNRLFLKYDSMSTTGTTYYRNFLAGGQLGITKLKIYSGDRPDITSIADLTAYESQCLITFDVAAYNATSAANTGLYIKSDDATSADYTGFKAVCGRTMTLTPATSSGTAKWFWFGVCVTAAEDTSNRFGAIPANYTNVKTFPFVTGSVGPIGTYDIFNTPWDLEIANTEIVQGELYKSYGFNFYVPAVVDIYE